MNSDIEETDPPSVLGYFHRTPVEIFISDGSADGGLPMGVGWATLLYWST